MAERRLSRDALERAERLPELRWPPAPGSGLGEWLIQDAAGTVAQPFYAALDDDRRLCWTDSPTRAALFRTKVDAERFVLDRLTTEARVITQR